MTTRIRSLPIASVALLALGLGLAACADEAPRTEGNEASEVVTEIAPPEVPEPVDVAAPVVEEAPEPDRNAVAAAPVGIEEEPVPVDQQTLEDADATGMTSRYTGEGESAGNESGPAD